MSIELSFEEDHGRWIPSYMNSILKKRKLSMLQFVCEEMYCTVSHYFSLDQNKKICRATGTTFVERIEIWTKLLVMSAGIIYYFFGS